MACYKYVNMKKRQRVDLFENIFVSFCSNIFKNLSPILSPTHPNPGYGYRYLLFLILRKK